MKSLLLLVTSVLLISSIGYVKSELIAVQVLFRHGDRNIDSPCPADRWKDEKNWAGGYGQLTNVGKQQHYKLGRWLRDRYKSLLPNGYSADNVYVVSSEYDRTLMSAASNLAGLFPPEPDQVWNENLLWQPIPINMIPRKSDIMLLVDDAPCPAFDSLYKKYNRSIEMKMENEKYKHLYPLLTKFCGKPICKLVDAVNVYDILKVEQDQNKTTPDWAQPELLNELKSLSTYYYQSFTATQKMARLRGGFLIKHILDIFIAKSKSILSPDRSFFMYSAHDNTIINVLNSLQMFDNDFPPYASSVLFELHKSNGIYSLKIFYKKSEVGYTRLLNIKDCGTECPLDDFHNIYKKILPTKGYTRECGLDKMQKHKTN